MKQKRICLLCRLEQEWKQEWKEARVEASWGK